MIEACQYCDSKTDWLDFVNIDGEDLCVCQYCYITNRGNDQEPFRDKIPLMRYLNALENSIVERLKTYFSSK